MTRILFEKYGIIISQEDYRPMFNFSDEEKDWYFTIYFEDTDDYIDFMDMIEENYDGVLLDQIKETIENILEQQLWKKTYIKATSLL